ncbi:Endopeptidase S2P [Plasmodiophora brassicae]
MVVVAAILCGVAGWAVVLGCVVARFRNDERLSWSSSMFTIWLDGAPWADGLRRRMALHRRPAVRAWRRWFAIGPPIAVVLMVVSAVVLLTNFVRVFLLLASPGAHVAHADVPSTLVVPLIPAVTFPIWQTVYLWVAVLVSVVIHEIGHAACAIVYDVPITRIGVASVFLIPIAFVEIDQQRLEERSHVARQVASAGILHNVALAVLCRMLISLLPVLLLPLYSSGARPIISWISPESPLYANVTAGCDAVVASLNGVPVTSAASLQDHLSGMAVGPPGLCMDRSAIDASRLRFGSECCNSSTAPGHCFQADDSTPPFCVASRDVLPSRPIQCVQRDQCKAAGDRCVAPSAQDQRVVYIDIHTRTLIFVGDPLLLGATMEVTDLQPRLPGVVPVRGPIVVAEFLRLAMSVSTSLAFVNAAPVNYFDGEHLAMAFLTPSSNGAALVESALHIGSLCLIANVILGVAVKLLAR